MSDVRRIVANFAAPDPGRAETFYGGILGLRPLMDHGWIVTWGNDRQQSVQVSFASEGGSGTPVPNLSIEVGDLQPILDRLATAGVALEYGPVAEPWGVTRVFVRDPWGRLVNILVHTQAPE